MKNHIYIIILIVGLFGCKSKPEPKLELFNPEAFAFDVGESWEVNATINAKDFAQKEVNDEFLIKLFYSVDLITSENDTLKKIFEDTLASNQKNEFIDIPIETQVELDTTFEVGKYKLIFNVVDEYSKQKKIAEVSFNLSKE